MDEMHSSTSTPRLSLSTTTPMVEMVTRNGKAESSLQTSRHPPTLQHAMVGEALDRMTRAEFEYQMGELGYRITNPTYDAYDGGAQLWAFDCPDGCKGARLAVPPHMYNEQVIALYYMMALSSQCSHR